MRLRKTAWIKLFLEYQVSSDLTGDRESKEMNWASSKFNFELVDHEAVFGHLAGARFRRHQ